MQVRLLQAGDEEMLDAFLEPHTPFVYYMRSNAQKAGLVYQSKKEQAEYIGAFKDNLLVGVLSHTWLGSLLIFVTEPMAISVLGKAWLLHHKTHPRNVDLLAGLTPHIEELENILAVEKKDLREGGKYEGFFTLEINEMTQPIVVGAVRRAAAQDIEVLAKWRHDFQVESLGDAPGAETYDRARTEVDRSISNYDLFVQEIDGNLVSFCRAGGFLKEWKFVGSVWTPPDLRKKGYARAVTAGALKILRHEGATYAALFTNNAWAERSYRALGFNRVANWSFHLLIEPRLLKRND